MEAAGLPTTAIKEVKVSNYQTARSQLMNKPFLGTSKYREQQGRANRIGVYQDPETGRYLIGEFEKALVRKLAREGMPFFAHNMVRTPEEQDRLFERRVSNAGRWQSPHNYGMAVDIVHSVRAWELDKHSWALVGHIGKEVSERLKIDITWGGDWEQPWDPAHWELRNWRSLIVNHHDVQVINSMAK